MQREDTGNGHLQLVSGVAGEPLGTVPGSESAEGGNPITCIGTRLPGRVSVGARHSPEERHCRAIGRES